MKRPKSYDEDLDEVVAKDWSRREIESDRLSLHRRFYLKPESLRRASSSSSYDRSIDEERELLRPPRKRIEYKADGFDGRKSYDRYLDGDRSMHVPSPRGSYGSPLMRRSESFSAMKREFPKGFRSERDRPRRNGSEGSSWRRLSSGNGLFDDGKMSSSGDSEDQSRTRPKVTSSGAQRMEMPKGRKEKLQKAACSSSEMEEGELEPDPATEPKESSTDTRGQVDRESEKCKINKDGSTSLSQSISQNKETSLGDKKREVRSVEMEVDSISGNASVGDGLNENSQAVKELNDERKQEDGFFEHNSNVETLEDTSDREKKRSLCDENSSFHVAVLDMKHTDEKQVIKEDAFGNVSACSQEAKFEVREGQGSKIERYTEEKAGTRVDHEVEQDEGRGVDLEVDQQQGNRIDFEAEAEVAAGFFCAGKECSPGNNVTLMLMTDNMKESQKGKDKVVAVSLSKNADSAEDEDAVECPNAKGFDLILGTHFAHLEKAGNAVFSHGKIKKNNKLKLEPLDLSLSLPIDLPDEKSKPANAQPSSPHCGRSIQSFPCAISDGFTTTISFSSSQPFVHNPSCSLTQNSMENYEQSVGSHPLFQCVDQVSSSTIFQAQTSNESKRKGGAGTLFQRVLLNGNSSYKSLQSHNGDQNMNVNGLLRQSNLPRQLSPTRSLGSHDTRSEHSKDKRMMTRDRSSNSLYRSEQREWEQLGVNGQLRVVERIIMRIVSESFPVMGRMIQEMTEHSVAYVKEAISKMLANRDKRGEINALQEVLHRRSDLTADNMQRCPRALLEIIVAVKTGLLDFLQRTNNVPSSDLVEIFLNSKCRNLSCRSTLPVDGCDCKVCSQKSGFCSACMCIVCSKFDMASNTCSWVGCDVCLHWCHTDCGLMNQHITNGRSSTGTPGATEIQFNCIACGHPSEMFGFVKEVFQTCSKDWKVENLAKELHYVKKIFSASNDLRGKSFFHIADQMMEKLEDKTKHSEVISYIMAFLSKNDPNIGNGPSSYTPKEPLGSNLHPGKVSCKEHTSAASTMNVDQRSDSGLCMKLEKKPIVDELESVVRFKKAEAKMYQERADNARREAEGLKRIAVAKNVKTEEEHRGKIAKLQIHEAEVRRRQKLEELQASERAHREFINMKTRMQAEITDLLLKMESTKLNFNA